MRPPKHTPNSLYSLQATEYAQEQGKFLEYHHAAYEAYWDHRADLGDPSVLADIGSGVSASMAPNCVSALNRVTTHRRWLTSTTRR